MPAAPSLLAHPASLPGPIGSQQHHSHRPHCRPCSTPQARRRCRPLQLPGLQSRQQQPTQHLTGTPRLMQEAWQQRVSCQSRLDMTAALVTAALSCRGSTAPHRHQPSTQQRAAWTLRHRTAARPAAAGPAAAAGATEAAAAAFSPRTLPVVVTLQLQGRLRWLQRQDMRPAHSLQACSPRQR